MRSRSSPSLNAGCSSVRAAHPLLCVHARDDGVLIAPHPAVSPRAAPVLENSQRRPGHAMRRQRSTVCICVGTVHPHVDARAGGVGGRLGVSVSWLASCGPGWAAIKQPEQDRCTTTNGTGGAQRTDGCRVGRRCGLAAREHGREWGEVAGGRPRPLSTRGTTLRQGRRGGSA